MARSNQLIISRIKEMTKTQLAASSAAALGLAVAGQKDGGGGSEPDPVLAEIKSISAGITKQHDQFKETLAKLEKDASDGSAAFKSFKEEVDVKLTDYNGSFTTLSAKLDELAQKALRAAGEPPKALKSVGERVAEFDGVKDFQRGRIKIPIEGGFGRKNITSAADSAGALIDEERKPGIVRAPDRRFVVRDLLAQGRTMSNAVEFVREVLFSNNAAVQQNEGDEKAESNLTYELEMAKVATIAHWIHVAAQTMSDAGALASDINNRLLYGLGFKEELQILKADGENGNLSGLVTEAREFAVPGGIPPGTIKNVTSIDVLRVAALQATVKEYFATGYVLNHIDWALIELTKDGDGRYIIGQPQGAIGANMWNIPVAATNAMDSGSFLTGDFALGAQIYDREDASVFVSTEDRDNFIKNKVTVLAEERLALAVYQPDAFITGTFTAGVAALSGA